MVNLLAGREVVPELLQEDCTPEKLAATLRTLLDGSAAAAQRAAFREVMATLAPEGRLPSESPRRTRCCGYCPMRSIKQKAR